MLKVASAATVLGFVLLACSSGGTGTIGSNGTGTPVQNGTVTAPSGMKVDATIAAATLGEECGESSAGLRAPSDCAGESAGDCGGGGFGCQESNVQIAFTSTDGSAPAKVEIVSVTLHDATDGTEVDELDPSNPQKWNTTGGYSAWDETIAPKTELKASYSLSAPAWSTMTNTSFSRKFRLHVTVKIDSEEIVLESAELSREPAVAT